MWFESFDVMTPKRLSAMIDPALGLSLAEWLDSVEDIALDHGDFEPLGPDHSAILIENGPKLLVTFETVESVRNDSERDVPLGWELAENHGWSQLCILGHGESWFRHPAIYQYFDRLIDEDFFDKFDQVVFYGSKNCGYAAAAYSVAAPGATVVAISPMATLDPEIAGWDKRFASARRQDFTSRFGFAPDMCEAAAQVHILFDPTVAIDAVHAALFHGTHIERVRCRHLGGQIELFLRRMNLLDGLMQMAMAGRLRPAIFHAALRQRRAYLPYLRRLLGHLESQRRPYLSGLMCRSVLNRINTPRFRRQLTHAENQLAKEGRALPAKSA